MHTWLQWHPQERRLGGRGVHEHTRDLARTHKELRHLLLIRRWLAHGRQNGQIHAERLVGELRWSTQRKGSDSGTHWAARVWSVPPRLPHACAESTACMLQVIPHCVPQSCPTLRRLTPLRRVQASLSLSYLPGPPFTGLERADRRGVTQARALTHMRTQMHGVEYRQPHLFHHYDWVLDSQHFCDPGAEDRRHSRSVERPWERWRGRGRLWDGWER